MCYCPEFRRASNAIAPRDRRKRPPKVAASSVTSITIGRRPSQPRVDSRFSNSAGMLRLLFRQGKSQLGAAPDGTLWFHSTFPCRRFAAVVICLFHFFANLGVTTQTRVAIGPQSE